MPPDPLTLQVIQAALDHAAGEMFAVLRKTAMSPVIHEVLDAGTGITDAAGALVSSGAGIPSFVGVLDKAVTAICKKQGTQFFDGDVFLLNDPCKGGVTHLNDVIIAAPVFFEGECVAWVASIAHWSDIGGKVPGSMAADATDIFSEGLRLPVMRLTCRGKMNRALADIIIANSRLPDFAAGDLWAQIAAGGRAARIIRTLCKRYGPDTLRAAIQDARRTGLRRALAGLATLPHGRFAHTRRFDGGTSWRVAIEITHRRFTVDLREAPPQAHGPHNTSREGAQIACQIFFKALCDPERFANAGSFAPLRVLTRPGSIFDPADDAPHGFYFETRIQLIDMLWQCLAAHCPDRLPAGHFASIFGAVIAGIHPDTGRPFTMVEPQQGGWGASPTRPGNAATFSTNHGDTFNCPAEIAEARYGLEVVQRALNVAPIHPGMHPGGHGVITRYRIHGGARLSAGFSHHTCPVWGLEGAADGGLNRLQLYRGGRTHIQPAFVSGVELQRGDEIEITTAFGGSAPKARRPCTVRAPIVKHPVPDTPGT